MTGMSHFKSQVLFEEDKCTEIAQARFFDQSMCVRGAPCSDQGPEFWRGRCKQTL